jgi:hypothetical protein
MVRLIESGQRKLDDLAAGLAVPEAWLTWTSSLHQCYVTLVVMRAGVGGEKHRDLGPGWRPVGVSFRTVVPESQAMAS